MVQQCRGWSRVGHIPGEQGVSTPERLVAGVTLNAGVQYVELRSNPPLQRSLDPAATVPAATRRQPQKHQ